MTARTLLRPDQDVVSATLDDETVLLHVTSGMYFGLDEVGTRVWQLLVAGSDVESIISQLVAVYEVEEKDLRGDIEAFLRQLEENGLVHGECQ